jgi:hypothetical protein
MSFLKARIFSDLNADSSVFFASRMPSIAFQQMHYDIAVTSDYRREWQGFSPELQ